ncbi:protein FAM151A-like [Ptychodera flava]|uniref:protein FAM151A-like n=1 Tax=Ptychodera flava TaxID=63121 RepID=UPI00396A7330
MQVTIYLSVFALTTLCLVESTVGICICSNTIVNVVDFYEVEDGDGLHIVWAHGVNSQSQLKDALNDDTMMLEGDIVLEGMGTPNETDTPVMAHPPIVYSDITLEEWIYNTTETNKGMKLDFKQIEAVEISMNIVKDMESRIHQPLWVNADIVRGPNSESDPIPPVEFITTCNRIFPLTVMSLGWTTNAGLPWAPPEENMYSWTMIYDNLMYTYPLENPVTFPVRALWAITSWQKFVWLLGLRDDFSITVWHGSGDQLDEDGLVALRKHGDPRRIYYDLPDLIMDRFLEALKKYENVTVEIDRIWDVGSWNGLSSGAVGDHVYLSLEGAGLAGSHHGVFIESKAEHKPSSLPTEIHGQVQFVPKERHHTFQPGAGLEIYLRSAGVSNLKSVIGGIRINIAHDGNVFIEPNEEGGDESRVSGSVVQTDCYEFSVTDSSERGTVTAKVTPARCSDGHGGQPPDFESVEIEFEPSGDHEFFYIVMTKTGDELDIVLEDVHVLPSEVSTAWKQRVHYLFVFLPLLMQTTFQQLQ